jgi:two-component system, NarL family, response regulator
LVGEGLAVEVLLIDVHPLMQAILRAIVQKALGGAVVHSVRDLEQGLSLARQCDALDLVLLDPGLQGCNAVEAIKRLRDTHRNLKVIIVSADTNPDTILESLRAGAAGYITRMSKPEVIASALRIVAAGETYVPSEVLLSGNDDNLVLSRRELEVLHLMVTGLSNREMASQLAIAENTVKQHVGSIYAALGAHTRAQAMASAMRRGFSMLA